ncbi:transposase [Streptomyces sp. NPDC048419]|uniref:transposase n=1 Tax=Streptomyces sp. NPDC048419 TaxID=3365547 RepID=UPI003719CF2D
MESGRWTIDDPAAFGGRDAPQLTARVPPQGPRLVASGRRVAEVAQHLGISDQTIYVWRRQHLIDTGQLPARPAPTRPGLPRPASVLPSRRPSRPSTAALLDCWTAG